MTPEPTTALSRCCSKPLIETLFVTALCGGCHTVIDLRSLPEYEEGRLLISNHGRVWITPAPRSSSTT